MHLRPCPGIGAVESQSCARVEALAFEKIDWVYQQSSCLHCLSVRRQGFVIASSEQHAIVFLNLKARIPAGDARFLFL